MKVVDVTWGVRPVVSMWFHWHRSQQSVRSGSETTQNPGVRYVCLSSGPQARGGCHEFARRRYRRHTEQRRHEYRAVQAARGMDPPRPVLGVFRRGLRCRRCRSGLAGGRYSPLHDDAGHAPRLLLPALGRRGRSRTRTRRRLRDRLQRPPLRLGPGLVRRLRDRLGLPLLRLGTRCVRRLRSPLPRRRPLLRPGPGLVRRLRGELLRRRRLRSVLLDLRSGG